MAFDEMEGLRELILEAKSVGLAAVVWSYPRGGSLTKDGETAMDVSAYAAHMAALMGAHIIKVKPSTAKMEPGDAKKVTAKHPVDTPTPAARANHGLMSYPKGRAPGA